MLTGLLHMHSLLRYLIIIVAILAIVKLISAKNQRKSFGKSEKMPALFYMIIMDVQLLIGLFLYFFVPNSIYSRIMSMDSFSDAMKDKILRFFTMEHMPLMIIAMILVHIGYAVTKKDISDNKKYSKAITYFVIGLIILLAAVPWPFRDLGKGWMPGM